MRSEFNANSENTMMICGQQSRETLLAGENE